MAEILSVSQDFPDEAALRRTGEVLLRGGAVALPTDTVYGLCARALDPDAVARLFAVKGREEPKGAPVLIGHRDQLASLARPASPRARGLIELLWPGELTLIFPPQEGLSRLLLGEGGDGVAVRLPRQGLCRFLALMVGPFAATSANAPGEEPLASARVVEERFGGKLDLVLDGGPARGRMASTVVDARGDRPVLLRKGSVPFPAIRRAWERMGETAG